MALLDTLSNRKAMPMSGRATFGIQRPSLPPRRLEKVRPIVLNEMQQNPAPYEGEGFERLTGNSANADVNAEMPSGEQRGEIMENPRQGQGRSDAQDQTDSLFAQIAGLQNKDYGEKKRGGFKDILIALGMGALQGVANSDPRGGVGGMLGGAIGGAAAGGIGGAVDGSTDNRMRDRLKLDKLYGDYSNASKIADAEQRRAYQRKRIEDVDKDNAARDAAAAAKVAKDERDYGLKLKTLEWKMEDRDEYYRLEGHC